MRFFMYISDSQDIDTSQFSQTDLKRLTDYVDLLMSIERRVSKNSQSATESKHEH